MEYKFTDKEKVQITKSRRLVGLSDVRTGRRNCLRCDRRFYSSDLKNQKCCDRCRLKHD